MQYAFPHLLALAACFAAQHLALHASGGRFTKSESNFFSSLGRIQAGAVGKPTVMFLGGLWHGAAWKFALWGSLHGLFLAAERLVAKRQGSGGRGQESGIKRQETFDSVRESKNGNRKTGIEKRESKNGNRKTGIEKWESKIFLFPPSAFRLPLTALRWLLTFHLVTALWLTFMMPNMASIVAFFQGVFSGRMGFSGPPIFSLMFYGSTIILYHAWGWFREHRVRLSQQLARSPLEPLLHGVMIFLILTNPGAPRGFIYFQF